MGVEKRGDGKRGKAGKVRVLFVFNSCKRCGPTQVILNIIMNLDFSKYEPVVLTFREEPSDSSLNEIMKYAHKHVMCEISKSDILLGRLNKLKETLDKIDADVIHTTGVFPDYVISRISGHNQVVTMHNYAPVNYVDSFGRLRGSILVKMQYYAANHAAMTVACSKKLAELYCPRFAFDYIRNGVNLGKFTILKNRDLLREQHGITSGSFVFIYTGHLSAGKNVEFVLKNFREVFGDNENVVLLLLGSGPEELSLKSIYGLLNNVRFIGRVEDVSEYLAMSDVYISASKSEGLPNGVLEAMACGLPVLLSNIPQHMEVLESDKKCGYAFSLDDGGRQLRRIMKKMVRNDELPVLSSNARETMEECFSSKNMSKKYQEIYSDMADKRKITLFIGGLSGGGAERVTCNLANFLNENGYKVDVITMSNARDTYKLDDGINRICLLDEKERAGMLRNLRLRQKRLREYVVRNKDVACYVVMLPITIFMLVRLKKLTYSKMIISERNNPGSYRLYEKILMRYAARRCDGLVVQTKKIGEWYRGVKNKVVIPNAINKDIVFPERKNVKKKIVTVSRLERQKNIPMLIEAFVGFSKNYPDYVLEIYGKGGQENNIKALVKKYGLDDKIRFMGYVDNITSRIADAFCFVLTSNFEGMPNALIEAMCIGIPCIATDCDGGGARELIKDGENGLLIEKNNVGQLVDALEKMVRYGKKAAKFSSRSVIIRSELSYVKIYSEWNEYINDVIELGEKI